MHALDCDCAQCTYIWGEDPCTDCDHPIDNCDCRCCHEPDYDALAKDETLC